MLGSAAGHETNEFSIRSKILDPLEIVSFATITPSGIMEVENVFGQISKGFYADFWLLKKSFGRLNCFGLAGKKIVCSYEKWIDLSHKMGMFKI